VSLTKRVAQFALDVKLETLPAAVVENAHMRVLDTIGVTLAGLPELATKMATELALETVPTGPSTIIGSGKKTSVQQAAFVNGVSAHALEFDDMSTSIISHTSATVVPAMLSLAESLNVSGKTFLEAYVASFEVATQVGWSMAFNLLKHGWHPNGVLAVVGTAAGASKLLGANVEQTRRAIGIAASCASGIRKNVGFMTKPFHMGKAGSDGILAAQLAIKNYTADPDILERGPSSKSHIGHAYFSYPEVFVGEGDYNLAEIERGLGKDYELATDSTITRFHPGSSFPQAAIDEIIDLSRNNKIDPSTIEKIKLGVTPTTLVIASYAAPNTAIEARFSLKFAIAAAAVKQEVTLRQYTDDIVRSAPIQDMMNRIEAYVPDEFAAVPDRWTGTNPTPVSCKVEIILKNGKSITGGRHTTRGYPGSPVVWNDAMEKYNDCASLVMSEKQMAKAADLIRNITKLDKISDLTAALII
jgi:2-methylcitrate dehydratase PrpD